MQEKYQCGPSALASVLNYYGINISPDKITALLSGKINGTLNLEMLLFPRRFGFITEMISEDLKIVKNYIAEGVPVILLVDNGFSIYRIPHYVVVIGYDEENMTFVAHWGDEPNRTISEEELLRRWNRMGSWGFVVLHIPEDKMTAEQLTDSGVAMEMAGDLESAERRYRRAVELNPEICAPEFNLGNIYYKKGDYKNSLEWFKKALNTCEKKGDVYNNIAVVLMAIGEIDEAKEYVNKALMLEPANAEYLDTKRRIEEFK